MRPPCKVPGCDRIGVARGWCNPHYQAWYRYGDPEAKVRIHGDDAARFWSHVDKNGPGGCWLWTGALGRYGYAQVRMGGRDGGMPLVHRWAYEALVGPIPEGLQLDHLCRVRHCVNPAHLEPVTPRENTLRSEGPPALNAVKTHCIHGHPLSDDNVRVARDGQRVCRTCARVGQIARRAQRR